MNFGCLLELGFFSWKCLHAKMVLHAKIIYLHYLCGYFVLYWKASLPFLHIVVYMTRIQSSKLHMDLNNELCKKCYMFFESVDSWTLMLFWLGCSAGSCYFQNTGNISLVSKCFYLFFLQRYFQFYYCQYLDFFKNKLWGIR